MSDTLLRSKQVHPLPIGSGGASATHTSLNDTNKKLAMMTVQAGADSKYDPPAPIPVTKAVYIENFSNGTLSTSLFVLGGLFIVYAFVAK